MTQSDFISDHCQLVGEQGLRQSENAVIIQVSLYIIHLIMFLAWVAGSYHLHQESTESLLHIVYSHLHPKKAVQTDVSIHPISS